jgi:hypothetical protein
LLVKRQKFLGNGSNSVFPLQRTDIELLNSAATLANAELKPKTTLGQGVLVSVRDDLLNRIDFGSKRQIKGTDQRRDVRGDQRCQIRAATKNPAIRGSTKIKNQHGSEERTL